VCAQISIGVKTRCARLLSRFSGRQTTLSCISVGRASRDLVSTSGAFIVASIIASEHNNGHLTIRYGKQSNCADTFSCACRHQETTTWLPGRSGEHREMIFSGMRMSRAARSRLRNRTTRPISPFLLPLCAFLRIRALLQHFIEPFSKRFSE